MAEVPGLDDRPEREGSPLALRANCAQTVGHIGICDQEEGVIECSLSLSLYIYSHISIYHVGGEADQGLMIAQMARNTIGAFTCIRG